MKLCNAAWVWAMIGACLLAGCKGQPGSGGADRELRILGGITGEDPALQEPQVLLITSQRQLDELGSQALGDLEVNFKKEAIVLLALGEQPTGGYWAHISDVWLEGGKLHVRGKANRPAEDAITTQALTYPFDAVVIPAVGPRMIASDILSVVGEEPPQVQEEIAPEAEPMGEVAPAQEVEMMEDAGAAEEMAPAQEPAPAGE